MDERWRDAVLMAERRRRRRVNKMLRAMDRLDARQVRRPGRRHSNDRGRRRATAAVGFLVTVLVGLFAATLLGGGSTSSAREFPDRPADAQDSPIGSPAYVGSDRTDFAFIATQDGSDDPVTYDPCVPIHLTVHPRTIVDDGMRLLEEALDELRDATGLTFVVDGLTDDPPADDGTITDDRGGWLPATVSWSDPEESEQLKGGIAGYAGSASIDRDGHRWFVTGSVVLDGPQLEEIPEGRRGWESARSVVMHELAHLVGLDHVEAPGQLMQPEGSDDVTTWGAGDRAGLSAVGRGRCIDY